MRLDELAHGHHRSLFHRLQRIESRRDHGQRRLHGNAMCDRQGLVQLLAGRHHALHEVQPQRFGTVELVGRQQVQHRVAQACTLGHAQCCATGGHDAALHFQLGEAAVVGGHHDVGGQHQFDADREADPLDGHHHRLGATTVARKAEVVRFDQTFGHRLFAALHVLGQRGKVEAGREMIAEGMQHADPQVRIVVQPRVGLGQFAKHLRRPAVAFGGSVDADQQHMVEHLRVDAAFEWWRRGDSSHFLLSPGVIHDHCRTGFAGMLMLPPARGLAK